MIRERNLKIDWNKIILNNFLSPDRQRDSERLNKTAISMSKTLMENHKPNWKDYTKKKTFPYNKTKNRTTGYSPNFLLFGKDCRLPINQIFEIFSNIHNFKNYDEFLKN